MMAEGSEASGVVIELVLIAAVVLILFFGILIPFGDGVKDSVERKLCQASLQLTRAQDLAAPVCIQPKPSVVPLDCPRYYYEVSDDEVESLGEDVTEDFDDRCPDGSSDCLAKNVVAEEMAKCWDLFNRGEMIVFQQGEINAWTGFFKEKDTARACFVCSEVTLQTHGEITGLPEYLKSAVYSGDMSYYEFLAENPKAFCDQRLLSSETPTCWEGLAREREPSSKFIDLIKDWWVEKPGAGQIRYDSLPTGETYAITFMRRGMSTCDASSHDERGAIDLAVRDYLTFSVQAIPVDHIQSQCEVVLA